VLRVKFDSNVVIHCHHYNARIQNTVEQDKTINGKEIIYLTAKEVYHDLVFAACHSNVKFKSTQLISDLYSYLGFGILEFSDSSPETVRSSSSHFVEGWRCGTVKRSGSVCTMTEGYLAGALSAISGKNCEVHEEQCMNDGHKACVFKINERPTEKISVPKKVQTVDFDIPISHHESVSNIDKELVINAVQSMDIIGNAFGLIPAFNVYLANTPQDFYNLVSIRYLEAMEKNGKGRIAKDLLIEDAEYCALNTFYGILNSDEWSGLVAPVVKEPRDNIYGLVSIANEFGGGKLSFLSHESESQLSLISYNGYEAYGYITQKGYSQMPQCYMITGVSSGLMSLIYRPEDLSNRTGSYHTIEKHCLCCRDAFCLFEVTD